MTDRERTDLELGLYIAIGLVLGALLGLLATTLLGGELFWIGVGAGVGLIVATALALGLETGQGSPPQ